MPAVFLTLNNNGEHSMRGIDFIANGGGSGEIAQRLLDSDGDVNTLRLWRGKDGRSYRDKVLANGKKKAVLVGNTTATLRKNEWIAFDRAIVRAARPALQLIDTLKSAGCQVQGPGLSATTMEYQSMTDAGNAQLDMDGLAEAERDRVQFDLRGLPLPIAHADFSLSWREIQTSRRLGTDIDTTMIEQETHKVLELLEQLSMGTLASYSYAGYTVYGFRNYPYRVTKTFTLPTTSGWTPDTFVSELLDARQSLTDLLLRGPFALFYSPGWDKFFDADYSAAYTAPAGIGTLRSRLKLIDNITTVQRLEYMPNYEVVLVGLNTNTIRLVNNLEITPVQWSTHGGMKLNFKLLASKIPMLRRNSNDNTAIVHGVAA